MSESRGFLSRWALRKQQALQGEELPEEEISEVAITATEQDVVEPQAASAETATETDIPATELQDETAEEQVLTAEDLPDPSGIEIGGSFASFMAKNVDPTVRQAALRTLWKQPHFSEIDGMMEYALDYSNQEILTPEVSSELAKKVFRHLVKDEAPEASEVNETELADVAIGDDVDTEVIAEAETVAQQPDSIETTDLSDKMDGEFVENSQNDPLIDEKNNDGVV
ncbi:hypothetical protein HR45_15420 [Shewanella mangrovi]|uniref:DUF3306 domain-containing protein n=1 Tax=Shewanella mangrovi TaxID=1515746 RepID=A0A094JF62_9GAMM|nr:DUF3306 domain-containing protein [Shewanella mangrovi]KFZ36679.1 hypothetical protein HR45_15420 [Shewanella mangrovi]